MSIPFPGLTGPSYQLENKYAAVERTVNWYNTVNEAPAEETKFKIGLAPSPGNAAFSPLPVPAPFNQPNRGLLEYRGTAYGVNGNVFFSINLAGQYTQLGLVAVDANPASLVGTGVGQIVIASGGSGYVWSVDGHLFTPIAAGFLGASMVTFQDGYAIALVPFSNQFQVSGTDQVPLGDMTKWSPANVSVQAGQGDLLKALISSREYLRLFGDRRSQVLVNTGNNGIGGFPFTNYNETFLETGIAAPFSLADLGDSLMWIGQSARGVRACWRDTAFQPTRVSTFAIEQIWQSYHRIDDAVAFPFLWKGHAFYQITFPTAFVVDPPSGFPLGSPPTYSGATWIYDATTSMLLGRPIWTERSYQSSLGYATQRSEMFHCFCYGLHLVGSTGIDGNPGAIYQMSDTAFTDCGVDMTGAQTQQAIVRDRVSPHLWHNNKRLVYNRIEFEMARGGGLDGGVFGSNPQLLLRWSNDAGNTFGSEYPIPVGLIGQFSQRVFLNRLGYGRDRVFWLRATDPVYWGILGAQLDLFECAS